MHSDTGKRGLASRQRAAPAASEEPEAGGSEDGSQGRSSDRDEEEEDRSASGDAEDALDEAVQGTRPHTKAQGDSHGKKPYLSLYPPLCDACDVQS